MLRIQYKSTLALLGVCVLSGMPAWSQSDSGSSQTPVPTMVGVNRNGALEEGSNPETSGDRMMTPPPVSGHAYPIALSSQERSNYFRGGVSFTSAYVDNVLGSISTSPVSDVIFSVAPRIDVDATTARMHTLITYAPGFTFYRRLAAHDEVDQSASIGFDYRLSQNVTFSARDSFQKSSNAFSQPLDVSNGVVSGGSQGPNLSVLAPIADSLSNSGNVGITYQFGLNEMVGASGSFANLHYPNPSQVPGLFDSSSQGGLAFYSRRIAKRNYIGVTYGYQRLVAYPAVGVSGTQAHAALIFYTLSPKSSRFSFSFFGGPQRSDTVQTPLAPPQGRLPELRSWSPAAGASMGWQSRLTSFAFSFTHMIASGGALIGAVKLDSAMASARQQITRTLSASVAGGYSQNNVIGNDPFFTHGHSILGTASFEQQLGEHVAVQLAYTRLHQSYTHIEVISATPNTNRESISISYRFSKPLGR